MKLLAHRRNRHPNYCRKTFLFEPLEGRSLLAGDVFSSLDASGNLLLSGGAKADNLDLSYDSTLGAYVLSGTNTNIHDLSGNIIPSLTLNSATLAGFNGTTTINLGAGNDTLTINGSAANNADIAAGLNIDGGIGNDGINLIGKNGNVQGKVGGTRGGGARHNQKHTRTGRRPGGVSRESG